MDNPSRYHELILDAIDQLRRRKARPDLERISHMLERRHGLKYLEVSQELSKLVNKGIVIKVDYKGSTSYRNAAKWVKSNKSRSSPAPVGHSGLSTSILEAVDDLSLTSTEERPPKAAFIQDIDKYLTKKDSHGNLSESALKLALDKEVGSGNLRLLSSGGYCMTKRGLETLRNRSSSSKNSPKPDKNDSRASNKREKGGVCDYCLFGKSANRKGEAEKLLTCCDCNFKAHPSCMDNNTEATFANSPSSWQCPDCISCAICSNSGEGEPMLCCSECCKTYHMACHIPQVFTKPKGTWICSNCNYKSSDRDNNSMYTQFSDGSTSPASTECSDDLGLNDEFRKSLEKYPEVVPLANKWSVEEVEAFIKHVGLVDEANAFRREEVDGVAMLLMQRQDVVMQLKIKLGPAVKIYKHIRKLQERYVEMIENEKF